LIDGEIAEIKFEMEGERPVFIQSWKLLLYYFYFDQRSWWRESP